MTITFHVAPDAAERLSFACSPLLEAVLSLHVLVEPKHHPVQHEWVRRMRTLPPALKREIQELGFAYRSYFPALCFPTGEGPQLTFEEELARLRCVSIDDAQEELAVALVGEAARRDRSDEADDGARMHEALEARRASADANVARCAGLVLDDPAALVDRFCAVLAEYWDAAFCDEWQQIEPRLADAITEAGRAVEARGLYGLLRRFSPEVRSAPSEGRFWVERPHDHDVVLSDGERLTIVPSAYVWPHVRVNCDPPWPLCIVIPASFVVREATTSLAPAELVGLLRALGESTRLRAMRLLAVKPRSTEELAPLLDITPAALSKHLRQLFEAGLVTRRREGYYVLYALERDRLTEVEPTMLRFIGDDLGPSPDAHRDR